MGETQFYYKTNIHIFFPKLNFVQIIIIMNNKKTYDYFLESFSDYSGILEALCKLLIE